MIYPQHVTSTLTPRLYDSEPSFIHRGDPHFSNVWRPGTLSSGSMIAFQMETHFSAPSVLIFRTTSINHCHMVKIIYVLYVSKTSCQRVKTSMEKKHKVQASHTIYTLFRTLSKHVSLHWLNNWTIPLSALEHHLLLTPAMVRSAFDFCRCTICTVQQPPPAAMTLPFSHIL